MHSKHSAEQFASRLTVSQYEQEVRLLQGRMRFLLSVKYALSYIAVWTLMWGTVSLVLRMLWGTPVLTLLWGAVGWIPAVLLAGWQASRSMPERSVLRAWIDRQVQCGGLLMASDEVEMGQWNRQLPSAMVPTLQWRSGRSWLILGASLAFLCACFLMPEQQFRPTPSHRLAIGEQVGQLNQQIQALKQERVITKQRAEELHKELASLQKQARGTDPAKTWQALDHVSQKLQDLAQQAAEKSLAQAEKWNQAEQLASKLSQMAKQMKPEELSAELKKLSKMLQQALQADPALRKKLMKGMSKGMLKALKAGALKHAHLRHVRGMCRGGKQGLGKRLSKMAGAGLGTAKALATFRRMKGSKSGMPGMGGVSRGPGDAPMTWKSPSTPKGAKFKPNVLPPATLANLLSSQRVGMSVGRPTQKGRPGQGSSGNILGKTNANQSAAHAQKIYPQHLGTIRRYFQRK